MADAQHSILTLISYSISEDQAALIYELTSQFVVPNSLLSLDKTNAGQIADA